MQNCLLNLDMRHSSLYGNSVPTWTVCCEPFTVRVHILSIADISMLQALYSYGNSIQAGHGNLQLFPIVIFAYLVLPDLIRVLQVQEICTLVLHGLRNCLLMCPL